MVYWCGLLLMLASWMQPLHLLPWVSWHSEILAFCSVLCFVWNVAWVRTTETEAPFAAVPVSAFPLLWLGVLSTFQWVAGLIPFFGDVFVYWLYLLLCVCAMTLGYFTRGGAQWIADFASTILIGAIASAFIALMQAFELSGVAGGWINQMPGVRRPGANLGQPNQLATLLLLGLASTVYLLESRKVGKVIVTFAVLLLTTALAATESRAGALGYVALSIWWFLKYRAIGGRLKPWSVAIIGAAYLIFYWSWSRWMAEVFQIPGGALPPNTVAYNRWIIWPQLLEAMMQKPWWGWGLGQVSAAHNAVVHAYPTSESYTYAHNIILDSALGMGLPLTVLAIFVIGTWLWRRTHAVADIETWYCFAIVLPIATHSVVEFPFAYAYFLVPLMFAVGALEGKLHISPVLRLSIKFVTAGTALATMLLLWSAVEYLSIEEDFRIVRFEALNVGQTPSDYIRPKTIMFTQLDALLKGGRIVPRPNMPEQEIELARTVALRYPWPATQNRYALALALNGNRSEATRQLRVMRAQHGEKAYKAIRGEWIALSTEHYPQLLDFELP